MPGYLDRHRAARLMREAGLDALVLVQPETLLYAAGAFPGVATFWRRAGAAFLLVPSDPAAPLAAVVGDLQAEAFAAQSGIADVRSHRIWVDSSPWPHGLTDGPLRQPRPAQFDAQASLAILGDLLRERGLVGARLGLELGFVSAADFPLFSAVPVNWADCTRLVERLRAVKHPAEIDRLRRAAIASADGMDVLFAEIRAGMTAAQMSAVWRDAAMAAARGRGEPIPQSHWSYISVGGDGFAPGGPAAAGDLIKVDVGCVIDGYSSDGARTVVLGAPSADAMRIYDALADAFDTGVAMLKPGAAFSDIYAATAGLMWSRGFETYARGHFGHGVGASIWSEEWPFIAADADSVVEVGMVLAFETPWYLRGLGGFIIEDQVLITADGPVVMAPLPRGLRRVGGVSAGQGA